MTQNEIKTVEDCIKHLINIGGVDVSDRVIMNSIHRQISRNLALSDRQHAMMKEKLIKYKGVFDVDNFESIIDTVGNPIRNIDRSKTIKISELPDVQSVWRSSFNPRKENTWIEICFPFHKKTIRAINELVKKLKSDNYFHKNSSRSHFFVLNEYTIVPIMETFKDRNFQIQKEILDYYNEIMEIRQSPQEHIPMFELDQLVNVKQAVRDLIPQELFDEPLKLFDRRRRYGITDYGIESHDRTLLERLVFRNSCDFLSNTEEHDLQTILDAVYELDRYPMVVVLQEKHAEDQLYEFYREVTTYISDSEQSVLFRLDGQSDFNQFVKDKNLNNWVDNNTKIVYISTSKLPKIMINGDFNPITCFMYGSSANRYVDTYIQDRCDLIIYRDTDISPMRKYSNYYGNL